MNTLQKILLTLLTCAVIANQVVPMQREGSDTGSVAQSQTAASEPTANTCSICLQEMLPAERTKTLSCEGINMHTFHTDCIDEWLTNNNTCPVCNKPVLASERPPAPQNLKIDGDNTLQFYIRDGSFNRPIKDLTIKYCSLERLPAGLTSIHGSLEIINCPNFTSLGDLADVNGHLTIVDCPIQTLPASLTAVGKGLQIINCPLTSLGGITNVTSLYISNCPITSLEGITTITNELSISNCPQLTRLPAGLTTLQEDFSISNCPQLTRFPAGFTTVQGSIIIENCPIPNLGNLTTIGGRSWLRGYYNSHLKNCPNLTSLGNLTSVKDLSISDCNQLANLNDLPNYIEKLDIVRCSNLINFPTNLTTVEYLTIDNCAQITSLGNLTTVRKNLIIKNCPNLTSLGNLTTVGGTRTITNCPKLVQPSSSWFSWPWNW